MKPIFASVLLISVCLLDMLAQNESRSQTAPLNLWSHLTRRQAEGNEKSEVAAKGPGGAFVSNQEIHNKPLAIDQSTNDSSQNYSPNLSSRLTRRQAERKEPNDAIAKQPAELEIDPSQFPSFLFTNDSSEIVPVKHVLLPSHPSRRQAEKNKKSEAIATGSGGAPVPNQEESQNYSPNLSLHLTRRQAERNETSEAIAKGSGGYPSEIRKKYKSNHTQSTSQSPDDSVSNFSVKSAR